MKVSPYEQIRDAILDGSFAAGTQLIEMAIADRYGVSRTPVREALTRLEQDGLVERGPRGLVVRERSPEEILDIYEVRVVLEAKAARNAAERHTPLDLPLLRRAAERFEVAEPSDARELAAANKEFHQAIWHATHNVALIDLLERLSMHLLRYPETTLAYPGRWEQGKKEHRQIVEAIVEGDGDGAAKVAEEHFSEAREIRLELWTKGP